MWVGRGLQGIRWEGLGRPLLSPQTLPPSCPVPSGPHPFSLCPSLASWNSLKLPECPVLGSVLLGSLAKSAALGQATSYPCSDFKVWRSREQWTWNSRDGLKNGGAARAELGRAGLSRGLQEMVELASSFPTATIGALLPGERSRQPPPDLKLIGCGRRQSRNTA